MMALRGLIERLTTLLAGALTTAKAALAGFCLSAAVGVLAAIALASSRPLERALYPYTVFLQTVPIVAIAPLLVLWCGPGLRAVAVSAFIVSVFPVIANTLTGLRSVEPALRDLFRLYGATRRQLLIDLKLPSALPHILAGLRIAGGLSLIGAVVAEIAAGSAGAGSGLAYRIVESGYRLNIPRMFAALLLLSVSGIVIFFSLSLMSHLLLRRWHESALADV